MITETQWRSLGLLEPEYREIVSRQGRAPSPTELAMYSVEWSEHCGYSRSRNALKTLPRKGRYPVLIGQDAGGIVWDDLAILFKVESHNHPSQVQPRHGAATGVGGIIRDILANGARPIALLDSLRFGTDPDSYRIFQGVVDGIQFYGNCVGVPTVGGETCFHPGYNGNCLVNVMCIGLAPRDKLASARAVPGHSVMYLGSRTGKDGIGGCSVLASQDLGEADKRPSVQIGDPFAGKCLIEATLEAVATGHILAVKDMGAAGLTCTTSEMSAEGNCGMALSLDRVPLREHPMAPYEIMMSESQERMLAVVRKGKEPLIREIFHKWGLEAEVMGITTERPVLEISHKGSIVAELSPENLTSPPVQDLPTESPSPRPFPDITDLKHSPPSEALLRLLGAPNLCGKHWIYEQYDHMVQVNTVIRPGEGDAAVLRIKGTGKAIAATFDGNSRYTLLDPYRGGVLAVAEAARNLVCVGAEPAAVTDGLNFGNPDRPDRMGQFTEALRGVADACRSFGLPVVSGNVSFYNESPAGPIPPTPIIGMIGLIPDVEAVCKIGFREEGDAVFLLGQNSGNLSGSEYLAYLFGIEGGLPPEPDLEVERNIQDACLQAIRQRYAVSCHDCSDGGLAVALSECCTGGGIGAQVTLPDLDPETLFSEAPSRILLTTLPEHAETVIALFQERNVPFARIGVTGGDSLVLASQDTRISIPVAALEEASRNGLISALEGTADAT